MMDSILDSVKKALGIPIEVEDFDPELVMHINSVFMGLRQIGVGPKEGFSIEDNGSTWSEFESDLSKIQGVKTYVYAKVRMIFDPPTSSIVAEAMKNTISEMEWRLHAQTDFGGIE